MYFQLRNWRSGKKLALEGEFVVAKGEKTYLNDQLIVWSNQAINCYRIFLANMLLIHNCGPLKSRILNFQLF